MTIEDVAAQYEKLPYPPREIKLEQDRLLETVGDNLLEINHYCFQGLADFENGINCLVAGGGTGDAAIFLAEQLRHTRSTVTYIDLSTSSRRLAEARAKERSLTNICWLTGSILDLPDTVKQKFDYINCSGVLHHMEDPEEGLKALAEVLHSSGAINIMLYAKYGRHGVYILQEVLREMIPNDLSIGERIEFAREIIRLLPASNEFALHRRRWSDIDKYGDSGLFDLLLHSQDRCYDVNEVYNLAESAELHLVDFIGPHKKKYSPESKFESDGLQNHWKSLDVRQKQSLGERLASDIDKHHCVFSKKKCSAALPSDESLAVALAFEMAGNHQKLSSAMVAEQNLIITHTVADSKSEVVIAGTAIGKELLKYFDGRTPSGEAIDIVAASVGASSSAVRREYLKLFDVMHMHDWAFLVCAPKP
jgi:ubiquinone/menaquinone biosynthesis C-methylase UbiE